MPLRTIPCPAGPCFRRRLVSVAAARPIGRGSRPGSGRRGSGRGGSRRAVRCESRPAARQGLQGAGPGQAPGPKPAGLFGRRGWPGGLPWLTLFLTSPRPAPPPRSGDLVPRRVAFRLYVGPGRARGRRAGGARCRGASPGGRALPAGQPRGRAGDVRRRARRPRQRPRPRPHPPSRQRGLRRLTRSCGMAPPRPARGLGVWSARGLWAGSSGGPALSESRRAGALEATLVRSSERR